MNITLLVVGKTDKDYINQAVEEYFKRIKNFLRQTLSFCSTKTGKIRRRRSSLPSSRSSRYRD